MHFFRDVCGDVRITSEVLARRTATYRRWLDSYTEQHRIAVLTAPKGVRKEQVVAPYYRSFKADCMSVSWRAIASANKTINLFIQRATPLHGLCGL